MRAPPARQRPQGDGDTERVAGVVPGQHGKQQAHVTRRARHRSADAHKAGGMRDLRPVTGGGHAARCRLQPTDAAEVRRLADGTAAVAADAARGHAGSYSRGLAAARPAAGQAGIERVVGAANQAVLGLVVVEKLGAGRLGQNHRAGRAQPRHRHRIAHRHRVAPQQAAAGRHLAGEVEAVFHRHRHAGERPRQRLPGPRARLLGIDFNECVDLAVRALNPRQVGVHQFEGREVPSPDGLGHLDESPEH